MTGPAFVLAGWDSDGFDGLDARLSPLADAMDRLTQDPPAYPVLHYSHTRHDERASARALATLDEALTILRFGVPADHRSAAVLASARAATANHVQTVEDTFELPVEDAPPAPCLEPLRAAGTPTASDEVFADRLADVAERRRKLSGIVEADPREWRGHEGEGHRHPGSAGAWRAKHDPPGLPIAFPLASNGDPVGPPMSVPSPEKIFGRAAEEGERRLDQPMLELVATSFIAGFTIVFGIAALGIAHATVKASFGEVARLVAAAAFGIGLVMPIVGRVELFNENFFDPVAAGVEAESWPIGGLARLWLVTIVFNLVGGALLVAVLSVEGALPTTAASSLTETANEIVHRSTLASFASAIAGGALVALLSHMLAALEANGSRMAAAYMVGFLLALGPFDHVIVTALHVGLGMLLGEDLAWGPLAGLAAVDTLGNLVGGLGLVTLSHVGQAKGASGD
jgi:formate/nitrite transporter FocA (FNT family)